jgi:HEPN domain-containing protein
MKDAASDPRVWQEYAEEDLRAAEWILSASPAIPRSVCFHAQQSAEKYLKEFLLAQEVRFPKTHDLTFLLDMCRKLDASLHALADPCEALMLYMEPSRYPLVDAPVLTPVQAEQSVAHAKRVAQMIAAKLR